MYARLGRSFANLRHLWFLISHLCCLGSMSRFFVVSMCLAHVLNSCIGQLRNKTYHRVLWQAYVGFACKVCIVLLFFSETDSGKSGRRASVLQTLLSAYLRLSDCMRRS